MRLPTIGPIRVNGPLAGGHEFGLDLIGMGLDSFRDIRRGAGSVSFVENSRRNEDPHIKAPGAEGRVMRRLDK